MRIKVERSGGFAGIPLSSEMDAKDLPSPLLQAARKIIEDKRKSSNTIKSYHKDGADHYTYKISIKDGRNLRIIECNQFDIKDELKSLVKYIERNSKPKIG